MNDLFKIQQEESEIFKIQQERERGLIQNPARREREALSSEREEELVVVFVKCTSVECRLCE